MNNDKNAGPACSIDSRPQEGGGSFESFKKADVVLVTALIESNKPVVILLDAQWCGDCRNQMRNLPKFENELKGVGIDLYIFTAEGPFFDQFLSPAHKELAMRIYGTPVNEPVFGGRSTTPDTTSVMGKRGREAYPAIFFISGGKVLYWSIEDVSEKQLDVLSTIILDKSKSLP